MEKSKIKKILMVLGFAIVVVLMAYLIFNTFFKKSPSSQTGPGTETPNSGIGLPGSPDGSGNIGEDVSSGQVPTSSDSGVQTSPLFPENSGQISTVANGGITQVSSLITNPTTGATLSKNGDSVQFYNKDDGKFYMVNDKGDVIALSNKVFYNVDSVTWAPNKTKAVIEYPDKNKIVYDFSTEKQVTLPKHWEDFEFSSDSQKLVNKSLGTDPDNRWLIMSNSDGSQSKALEYIGTNDKDVIPSWSPNNQTVAMYTRGVDFNRNEVFFIGQNDENFKSTVVEGWGFDPLWSSDGEKLLYSVYSAKNELKPSLWLVNAKGDNIGSDRTSLQIETWAEKCTFANSNEVYCAVPKTLEKGAGLYPDLALKTSDDLYRIDLSTGQKELIAIPNGAYNVSSIIVSEDQKNIFFTDYSSNQIYKVRLK
jgi:hypothetical protein